MQLNAVSISKSPNEYYKKNYLKKWPQNGLLSCCGKHLKWGWIGEEDLSDLAQSAKISSVHKNPIKVQCLSCWFDEFTEKYEVSGPMLSVRFSMWVQSSPPDTSMFGDLIWIYNELMGFFPTRLSAKVGKLGSKIDHGNFNYRSHRNLRIKFPRTLKMCRCGALYSNVEMLHLNWNLYMEHINFIVYLKIVMVFNHNSDEIMLLGIYSP